MKERILKLCKRLDKFTFEDILTIAEDINEATLELLLLTLVNEKRLILKNDIYFYSKNKTNNQNLYSQSLKLPRFFQYHTKEEINLIIKCFCAEIPSLKTSIIIELSNSIIGNFYSYFRRVLYKNQLQKLKQSFAIKPKIPSIRTLYDIKIYMYNYNNEIYLTDKPLKSINHDARHTKEEMRNMNVAYYRIRRVFQNYAFTKSIGEIAYEKLWMQDKTQEEKLRILKALLNIS